MSLQEAVLRVYVTAVRLHDGPHVSVDGRDHTEKPRTGMCLMELMGGDRTFHTLEPKAPQQHFLFFESLRRDQHKSKGKKP